MTSQLTTSVLLGIAVLMVTCGISSAQTPTTGITQSENAVNSLIHHCWLMAYTYDAMAAYFGRPEVGQKFMEELLHQNSDRHLARARELEEHLNMIGGSVKYMEIKIGADVKTSALEINVAIEQALTLEVASRNMLKDLIDKEAESETGHFLGKFLHHDSHAIAHLRTLKARADLLKYSDVFYFAKMLQKESSKATHPRHFGENDSH
jgi:ferritin